MRILTKYLAAVIFWILLSSGFTASLFLSEITTLQNEKRSEILRERSALAQQLFDASNFIHQNKKNTIKILSNIKNKSQSDIVLWNPQKQILSTFSPLLHNKVALRLRNSTPDQNNFIIKMLQEKILLQFKKSASKNIWIGAVLSTRSDYGLSGPAFSKFILSTLLFLLLSGLTIYLITRSVLRPVHEMSRTFKEADSNTLTTISEPNGNDEIQALVFRFNRFAANLSEFLNNQQEKEAGLSKQLQESRSRLVKLTDNLERVVARRTAELREKDAQLLQTGRLAGLGQLSTGIAHEINQPLNIIKLIVTGMIRQYSKNKTLDVDDVVKELNTINQQTIRVQKIIRHMKLFARKKAQMTLTEIDINIPVNDSMLLIGRQLEEHNVRLQLNLEEDLPKVKGDAIQIEQILVNLINNARDAVETKEAVLLQKGRKDYKKEITVCTCFKGQNVCIEISDNGSGMTDEISRKLFDPFFSTKGQKGTGLGLSITYNLIKNLNGDISVSSKAGKGTVITVSFPPAETGNEKGGIDSQA